MRASWTIPVAVFTLATGCILSDDPARQQTERLDSAGVEIVNNASQDRPLDWSMTEVLRLGGVDDGPEAFFRIYDRGFAADRAGRLYVLDSGRSRVEVFGPEGEHLRTMGREGEGPGEMTRPAALKVRPDGEALVLVGTKHALVRFGPDGSTLPAVRLPEIRVATGNVGVASSERLVLETAGPSTRDPDGGGTATTRLLLVESQEGGAWGSPVELAAIEWSWNPPTPVSAPDCPIELMTLPVFTPEPVWTVGPARLVYEGTAEYRFDVVDLATGRRTSVRRALPVVDATKARAAADLGPFRLPSISPACELPAEEHAEQVGWEDEIPWIVDLGIAPDGRIYVLRRAPDQTPSRRIDVFAPDGSYEGTLPPDIPFPDAWRSANEIIRRENDELDRMEIAVYRIGPR